MTLRLFHRAELKKELESLKESLATRMAGKRAADHMLFKMEAEVKRAARAVEQLEEEGAHFASKLEEVTLETETSKKSHGKHTERIILLLLIDSKTAHKTRSQVYCPAEVIYYMIC